MPQIERSRVTDALWDLIVLSLGSRDFGLRQDVLREGGKPELGGWLRKVKRKSASLSYGEVHFYIVDDVKGVLCETKKGGEIREHIPFHKIVACTLHKEDANCYMRIVAVNKGEKMCWELACADTSDLKSAVNWVAAIQLRTNCYDPVLDLDKIKVLRVALWLQGLYRGYKGRMKADRMRMKKARAGDSGTSRFGLQSMVSGLFGSTANMTIIDEEAGSDSESSVDDFGGKPNLVGGAAQGKNREVSALRRGLNLFSLSNRQVVVANTSNNTGKSTTFKSNETLNSDSECKEPPCPVFAPLTKECSSSVLPSMVCSSLNTVEDEVWENQRWSAVAIRATNSYVGWSDVALFPTERGSFSDRLGAQSWQSLTALGSVPPGWKLVKGWTLDLGSLLSGKCNNEGWMFAPTFASLDAHLASSRAHTTPNGRWLVRRRRWRRVRERMIPRGGMDTGETSPVLSLASQPRSNEDQVYTFGWLGMRGMTTGRWTNQFTFIPKGRTKDSLGVPLCYFRDAHLKLFSNDMSFRFNFASLTKHEVKVKYLDNECVVCDAVATIDQPGLFSLVLTGEPEPRMLNAHTAEARSKWVNVLNECIAMSPGPCYESIADRRSMRKGAAWELTRAGEAAKGMMGASVRGVKMGLLTITPSNVVRSTSNTGSTSNETSRAKGFHRAESDPDMYAVETLRAEMRKSLDPWNQDRPLLGVAPPRKGSVESLDGVYTTVGGSKPKTGVGGSLSPLNHRNRRSGGGVHESEFFPSSMVLPPAMTVGIKADDGMSVASSDDESNGLFGVVQRKISRNFTHKLKFGGGGAANTTGGSNLGLSLSPIPGPGSTPIKTNMPPPSSPSRRCISLTSPSMPLRKDSLDISTLEDRALAACEDTASDAFVFPALFENVMFDGHFDVSVDDFDTLFFREEDFTRDILNAEKKTDIELEPWTNGFKVGSEHRRRCKMPRMGVVPPGPAFHLLTRITSCPGKGYVVDQVCSTPDMPFGQHFSVDLRNIIVADGPKRCRVVISQRVTLFKTLMAQSFIKSGTKRELFAYYKNVWIGFVRWWLVNKRPHLLTGDVAAMKIQLSSGSLNVSGSGVAVDSNNPLECRVSDSKYTSASSDGGGYTSSRWFLLLEFVILIFFIAVLLLFWKRIERLEALMLERLPVPPPSC